MHQEKLNQALADMKRAVAMMEEALQLMASAQDTVESTAQLSNI